MKTQPQPTAELTHLSNLIAHIEAAMLTTTDGSGMLVSRPMSPLEMDGKGALWFFTDRRSSRAEHLRMVNLSFTDSARGTYVSLSGTAELHDDRRHIEASWTPFARPWFPDGRDSVHLALLKFVPRSAEYWDAPNSKMVRLFAMAVSMIAGKPLGQGEHGTLTELTQRPLHRVAMGM